MPLGPTSRNYTQSVETASRNLTTGDAFVMLYSNNGALVFTVPAGVYGPGTQISLVDWDGGGPAFAAGAGVTINSSGGLGPTAQYLVTSIVLAPPDLGDNVWFAFGSV